MTRVIGISGKKFSGKTTCCNYIHGLKLKEHGLVNDFAIMENGKLQILTTHTVTQQDGWGEFDVNRNDDAYVEYASMKIWPHIKIYSFADTLKSICVNLFDIPAHMIYGSEEQKNELTHLKWEDMPGVITPDISSEIQSDIGGNGTDPEQLLRTYSLNLCIHEPGFMTGREVMQYFGTDIMRRMYGPIWINDTLKRISQEQTELAIIPDVRFPNEVESLISSNAEVIRLNRNKYDDQHYSEIALDPENFDQGKFTALIDNENMTIDQLLESIGQIVYHKG